MRDYFERKNESHKQLFILTIKIPLIVKTKSDRKEAVLILKLKEDCLMSHIKVTFK